MRHLRSEALDFGVRAEYPERCAGLMTTATKVAAYLTEMNPAARWSSGIPRRGLYQSSRLMRVALKYLNPRLLLISMGG